MSGPVGSYCADRELVAAWSRAERAERAVLKLQKEVVTLRAELERCRRKEKQDVKSREPIDEALDNLQKSAERQQRDGS